MALRVFYIGIAIFAVALVFLTFQVPYTENFFKVDIDISTMEMDGIINYEVSTAGISAVYEADSGVRFHDRDEFINFRGKMLGKDRNHSMVSNKVISKGDELIFIGDAKYLSSDDISYVSQEIIYNTKDKTAVSNVPFILRQNENNVTGDTLVHDLNHEQTFATGVHAWYFFKD
ncbi:MAG: LPS export ABC transporter periplasmic protein LptC [Campylobacter sp.]|nr:LPS export ABC transporter periplasmic protein LptC [Campylobacter sp.]